MTDKEKFFTNLMIDIHTCRWTGTMDRYGAYMDAIATFSYAHTNSNFTDEDDKTDRAYDQLVATCEDIVAGKGYAKTVQQYVINKQQYKIPFPNYDYNTFECPKPTRSLYQNT
jgi:hypothetical protein